MSETDENKLIFIYNADSGSWNSFKDFFHKAFRKNTYQCNLCAVTYGAFGMKKDWKNFVNDIDVPVEFSYRDTFSFEFLHKDEFDAKYNIKDAKFPSAYFFDKSGIHLFISQDKMNAVKNVDELKELVDKKLVEFLK